MTGRRVTATPLLDLRQRSRRRRRTTRISSRLSRPRTLLRAQTRDHRVPQRRSSRARTRTRIRTRMRRPSRSIRSCSSSNVRPESASAPCVRAVTRKGSTTPHAARAASATVRGIVESMSRVTVASKAEFDKKDPPHQRPQQQQQKQKKPNSSLVAFLSLSLFPSLLIFLCSSSFTLYLFLFFLIFFFVCPKSCRFQTSRSVSIIRALSYSHCRPLSSLFSFLFPLTWFSFFLLFPSPSLEHVTHTLSRSFPPFSRVVSFDDESMFVFGTRSEKVTEERYKRKRERNCHSTEAPPTTRNGRGSTKRQTAIF